MHVHPFYAFSWEILSNRLGGGESGRSEAGPSPPSWSGDPQVWAGRIGRSLERGAYDRVLALGLGDGRRIAALLRLLPSGVRLTVAESDPELARRMLDSGRLDWWRPDSPVQLLADTSVWLPLWLLFLDGHDPARTLIVNSASTSTLADLRRKFLSLRPASAPDAPTQVPSLSFAAIVSPDEPDLPGFFAAVPSLANKAVFVWDAPVVPDFAATLDICLDTGIRPVHLARPLDRDFAAQRNVMLAACSGEWILYLDADERLSPAGLRLLPGLLAADAPCAWAWPRLTLYPTPASGMVGYGKWPDPQVRLFRRTPDLRFVRPIHEHLEGLATSPGLVLSAPILHYAHLLKDRQSLATKLALFNEASGGAALHRLNQEYPCLPLPLLEFPSAPALALPSPVFS